MSAAVGSPAFSIGRHKFVWIEGEPASGEKTRFYSLFGADKALRFLEAGNCHEVERKTAAVRDVATASGQPIRLAGVVDRDFRRADEIARLTNLGLTVLPCHEVENLFLHPDTLSKLASQLGATVKPLDAIIAASDFTAGMWIFQHASESDDFSQLDLRAAKKAMSGRDWADISKAGAAQVAKETVAQIPAAPPAQTGKFSNALVASIGAYNTARAKPDFWLHCMGKQVLVRIPKLFGFASSGPLELAVAAMWKKDPKLTPAEYQVMNGVFAGL